MFAGLQAVSQEIDPSNEFRRCATGTDHQIRGCSAFITQLLPTGRTVCCLWRVAHKRRVAAWYRRWYLD